MKKLLLTAVYVFVCAFVCNAETDKSIRIVEQALAKGDVKSIATIFDKTIDITFSDNKATTYSKTQASAILKRFFSKSLSKKFKLLHQGKSATNKTLYAIGKLYTNSANYRVYMFFVPNKKEFKLKELRFEKL